MKIPPDSDPSTIAFLGDYPPRLCGIATFTHDLCSAVSTQAPGSECLVVAVTDRHQVYQYPDLVRFEIQERELASYRSAADFLNFNNVDLLCVQHEFGIYGGVSGEHVLALLHEVRMPVVTTMHTVLDHPDADQRRVTLELLKLSDRIVVMANKGAEILRDIYGAAQETIDVIPHGIPDQPLCGSSEYKAQFGLAGRDVLFTFGLIGPGKGIEFVIKALPSIVRRHPSVVYVVLGATHPQLLVRDGEQYRLGLQHLAEDLGVADHVIFDNRFVAIDELRQFIGAADVYLTPYLNESQITSGSLAYVYGSGRVVVSTPYWHAKELLAEGRGVLVPFRDAPAIAEAVSGLLDDRQNMKAIQEAAFDIGRSMLWPCVGDRYLDTFRQAKHDQGEPPRTAFAAWTLNSRPFSLPAQRIDHVIRMTDGVGIFQHAILNVPNFAEGYCTDDNARGLVLCCMIEEKAPSISLSVTAQLETTYLAFLANAMTSGNGRCLNFMSHSRLWLEEVGSEDSHARALWAMGTGANRCRDTGRRRLCDRLFRRGLPVVAEFSSPRAWAFALIGIDEYLCHLPQDRAAIDMQYLLKERLIVLWEQYSTPDWPWFEPVVTYENARLCQALLLGQRSNPNPRAVEIALKVLRWLVLIQTTSEGCFRPIGNDGFYPRGESPAVFDQQPVEAQAMVAACLEAHRVTGDKMWLREARRAFEWFLGRNDLGTPLFVFETGGCSDGLHADGVSENQGAESTFAFHLSLADMQASRSLTPNYADGSS
ncbi:MAG: glycosyltransferase family 4 protein [Phycisphaeraceae bacterium]